MNEIRKCGDLCNWKGKKANNHFLNFQWTIWDSDLILSCVSHRLTLKFNWVLASWFWLIIVLNVTSWQWMYYKDALENIKSSTQSRNCFSHPHGWAQLCQWCFHNVIKKSQMPEGSHILPWLPMWCREWRQIYWAESVPDSIIKPILLARFWLVLPKSDCSKEIHSFCVTEECFHRHCV